MKQRVNYAPKKFAPRPEGPEYRVISNFASLLRSAREKKGMTQEDFAKFIRERESILAKWEAGTVTPGIDVAKRIGKQLGLSLIELEEVSTVSSGSTQKANEPTVGDFVKVRQRK
ncbi:TIGR00270 family protein [Candidatus Woesearchaeota archaeon]|nr:TIGR00270 family protein [Candidatus Woesearchaeota archaeon]